MNEPVYVLRGARALRRLLRERTDDLRTLDVAGFRLWLERHLARWQADPVFAQRMAVREIRRAHPHVVELERERRRLVDVDRRSPLARRIGEATHALNGTRKAVAGLTAATDGEEPARREELARRRDAKQAEHDRWAEEHRALVAASPERQALLAADAELARWREATGLGRAEAQLAKMQRARGRRTGHGGARFEDVALAAVRRCVLRDVVSDREVDGLRILRGVTLGAAQMEIDGLVVRPSSSDGPVTVLAVVEAKRNPNDLAHGFRQRQENLAWLTGDVGGYDADARRNRAFPTGHFDRAATHEEDGARYVVDRSSFDGFRRDAATGWFLDGLYFVTRPTTLWGVSGGALAGIAHRVATDVAWNPADEAYLADLFSWSQSLARETEAPDVLRTYLEDDARARQILLVKR